MSVETKHEGADAIGDAADALLNDLSWEMPPRGGDAGGRISEGAGATAAQHQKGPKPLTDEQVDKIVKQVEFYFSDANLPTDAFLMKKVRADPNGFVPIGVVCGFNRMKTLLKKHPPSRPSRRS